VWHNPYRGEVDHVVRIARHPAHKQRSYDRRAIDDATPRVELATDERGYLQPSSRSADATATVVFLGGSTTECTAVVAPLRFPAHVETLLRERGLAVDTLNAAVSGNTLHDSLNLLLNHVVSDAPDFAVVMHATNDAGLLAAAGSYEPEMAHALDVRALPRLAKQLASRRSALVGFVRERMAGYAFAPQALETEVLSRSADTIPTQPFAARLRAFAGLARGFGITPVLMTQPLAPTRTDLTPAWANTAAQQRFNDAIRDVARELDVVLIDLDARLRAEIPDWNEPMRYFYDGMHVTDAGSMLYADLIADALEPLVRARLRDAR
jgi:lysophospholipase L1-like esterase